MTECLVTGRVSMHLGSLGGRGGRCGNSVSRESAVLAVCAFCGGGAVSGEWSMISGPSRGREMGSSGWSGSVSGVA